MPPRGPAAAGKGLAACNTAACTGESRPMNSPAPWMLALGDHQPVPVTLDRVEGTTTHYLTPVTLRFSRRGGRVSLRATLTAPDGSQEAGIGSIEGIAWSRDPTATTTRVSFTPHASHIREPLT